MDRSARRLAALRTKTVETGTDLVAPGPAKNTRWVLGFHTYPFGVRLEEIVDLRADGPEILSGLARDAHRAGA